MNQKLWSGLTAALLVTTIGVAPSGYADPVGSVGSTDEPSEAIVPEETSLSNQGVSTAPQPAPNTGTADAELNSSPDSNSVTHASPEASAPASEVTPPADLSPEPTASPTPSAASQPESPPQEVVKVGEYQTQEQSPVEAIAEIQNHELSGRQAATLYVRDIPVLTFLGEPSHSSSASTPAEAAPSSAEVKVASVQASPASGTGSAAATTPAASDPAAESTDPVWRATTLAARINQLYRDNVDASTITVEWDAEHQRHVIKVGDEELIVLDENVILPDTTRNPAQDALQATNRIRRQMGNASPLSRIEGQPQQTTVSIGPVELRFSGMASWYGPGLHGNYSASGEIFNQEAMTAAHRSLPFGTQVRVTNLDNGRSVIVRINDRGPFSHGRVIDLSAGAARIIGLVHSGVAPVSLEVLGTVQ
ncbi:MAG: septal ring lytic transglycosylase RlpA family protein [Synechococcales cyanobacterium C42_A2020_086]|nr:septal ring lytic transglycosylase RlpA family protein [Synechococcales cyanobacterium C42_A2020_086]